MMIATEKIPEHLREYFVEATNTHCTVKNTALMQYLCRLVTPPGGLILDPFLGSGSTGKAAMLEGYEFTGIEVSPEYFAIAGGRIFEAASKTSEQDAA